MNYIIYLFNEIKDFIIDFYNVYYSYDFNDIDLDVDIHIPNPEMDFLSTFYKFFDTMYYLFFDPTYQTDDKKVIADVIKEKKYDEKYDEKYNSLQSIKLEEDEIGALVNKYVMEYTPVGNVVMYFDYNKRAFQYYSDFSVPYKFLECVSKKYCIVNKNRIYRDIKMEIDVNEFSIVRNSTSNLQNKSKSFAKLKGYNNSKELKLVEKDIVRYTHLGKLCNFSFVKNMVPKFKPVTYKDFIKNTTRLEDWVFS